MLNETVYFTACLYGLAMVVLTKLVINRFHLLALEVEEVF